MCLLRRRAWRGVLRGKVRKASQGPGAMWLQSGREGSPAPSFLGQGEQAWREPGFTFFPAEPEPNTGRVLVGMACGHRVPARGAHGCGLDFTVMLN